MGGRPLLRSAFTLTDLMILLMIAVLLFAGYLPAALKAYSDNKVKCASNLRQIGQAMLLYANENRQAWPRTRWDPDTSHRNAYTGVQSDDPFSEAGPLVNDVTAALFLLVRTQDVGLEVFSCPSDAQITWPRAATTGRSNFTGRFELSFSITDPYPSAQAREDGYAWNAERDPEFAVAADMNPGVQSLLAPVIDTSPRAMRRLNSANHEREGQNVLFADGHVQFMDRPFVGVRRDNIYTAGPRGEPLTPGNSLIGPPQHGTDSILLPTEVRLAEYVDPSLPAGTVALFAGGIAALVAILGWSIWYARRGARSHTSHQQLSPDPIEQ